MGGGPQADEGVDDENDKKRDEKAGETGDGKTIVKRKAEMKFPMA